jgi:lysine 2,3-aminomutase
VASLLEIDSIRDIRLASKALMGLPQHWLSDEVRAGMGRLAATARSRGVSIAIHTHVNHVQSVTPLVARAARAMLEAGVRDVRNQGVLLRGVNDSAGALLDLCFALLDEASIMPYYFYMCDMIPGSEHWRLSLAEGRALQHDIMGYLPGFATPRLVCDVPYVGKRWLHQVDQELPHRHRGGGRARAEPRVRVLRPGLHAARVRPRLVARPVGDGQHHQLAPFVADWSHLFP